MKENKPLDNFLVGIQDKDFERLRTLWEQMESSNFFATMDEFIHIISLSSNYQVEVKTLQLSRSQADELLRACVSTLKDREEHARMLAYVDELQDKIYQYITNVFNRVCARKYPSLYSYLRIPVDNLDESNMEYKMAVYIADVAILDLDDSMSRKEKLEKLTVLHSKMNDLRMSIFEQCLMGLVWGDKQFAKFSELMDSALLDSYTKQVILSGIMLSCLNYFDYRKWLLLFNTYRKTDDVALRQRALVGLVLILPSVHPFYKQKVEREMLKLYREDKTFKRELLMVSKLIIRTNHYEEDGDKMHKFVVHGLWNATAELMKEHLSEEGVDMDDDDFADDESYEDEEKGENSPIDEFAEEMYGMLEGGADLYYGQFKKTMDKTFASCIFNWFMPVYFDHPEFLKVRAKVEDGDKFFRAFLSGSTMCNNDFFSFLRTLPKNPKELEMVMQQMMPPEMDPEDDGHDTEKGYDMSFSGKLSEKADPRKSIMRATAVCLQDLYRFFTLAPMRHLFHNPFEVIQNENPAAPLLSGICQAKDYDNIKLALARYCLHQEEDDAIVKLLQPMDLDTEEYHYMLGVAHTFCKNPDYEKAYAHAKILLDKKPDNAKFKLLMVDISCEAGMPNLGLPYLEDLVAHEADEKRKQDFEEHLYHLYKLKKDHEKAVQVAYKLWYEHPEEDRFVFMLGHALISRSPKDPKTWEKVCGMTRAAMNKKTEKLKLPDLGNVKDMNANQAMAELMKMMDGMMKVDHSYDDKLGSLECFCLWMTKGFSAAESLILCVMEMACQSVKQIKKLEHFDIRTLMEEDWLIANGYSELDMICISEYLRARFNEILAEKGINDQGLFMKLMHGLKEGKGSQENPESNLGLDDDSDKDDSNKDND